MATRQVLMRNSKVPAVTRRDATVVVNLGDYNDIYIYVCMYVYMYVCMYVCIYLCIYVSMYLCMYVC